MDRQHVLTDMIKNDYIMQMIEKLAQAIASAMRLSKTGEHEQARQTLDDVCRELTGLDLHAAQTTDVRTLLGLVREPQAGLLVAQLLSEYAPLAGAPREAQKKAFMLYDALDQGGLLAEQGEHRERFAALIRALS